MDNAFQELDYSDISAKNINKRDRSNEINTKTRGGIIRLGSLLIIAIIILVFIILIISKTNKLSEKENELSKLKEQVLENEQVISQANEKNVYLQHQILESEKTKKILNRQKTDIMENIRNLELSNEKSKVDIKNATDTIISLQSELKEFEKIKNNISKLQSECDYYRDEKNKIKNGK